MTQFHNPQNAGIQRSYMIRWQCVINFQVVGYPTHWQETIDEVNRKIAERKALKSSGGPCSESEEPLHSSYNTALHPNHKFKLPKSPCIFVTQPHCAFPGVQWTREWL